MGRNLFGRASVTSSGSLEKVQLATCTRSLDAPVTKIPKSRAEARGEASRNRRDSSSNRRLRARFACLPWFFLPEYENEPGEREGDRRTRETWDLDVWLSRRNLFIGKTRMGTHGNVQLSCNLHFRPVVAPVDSSRE